MKKRGTHPHLGYTRECDSKYFAFYNCVLYNLECAVFQSYLAAAVMECVVVHHPTLPILYLHEPGAFCWTPILQSFSGRHSALGQWLRKDKNEIRTK